MVFTFADIWYLTLAKGMIISLALAIMGSIIVQSLWNCGERCSEFSAAVEKRKYRPIVSNGLGLFVNLLFIWIMVQGLILLLFGYFGVSPKELLSWRFQELTMVSVLVMVWQHGRYKRRSTNSK